MNDIKEIKTINCEFPSDLDKRVNNLLKEDWTIFKIDTVGRGSGDYENFYCVLVKYNKDKKLI